MTTDVKLRFDYTSLAGGVATEVARRTREIKRLTQRAAEDIVRIGDELTAVKAALPHGRFGLWLQVEFAWSEQTARRMMQVAEKFKTLTVSDLEFSPTALYLLSSDDVPEAARQEAVETAKAGTPVTKAAAREIVAKHKPERKADDRQLSSRTVETPPADPAAAYYEGDSEPVFSDNDWDEAEREEAERPDPERFTRAIAKAAREADAFAAAAGLSDSGWHKRLMDSLNETLRRFKAQPQEAAT